MGYCPLYDPSKHGYYCMIKRDSVGWQMYHDYCDSTYEKCPLYEEDRDERKSDGCFVTTACITALGLSDDCSELQTLREFRDGYVTEQISGKADVDHYYRIAPEIIEKINSHSNFIHIYDGIYKELVLPCVELINKHRYSAAYSLYRDKVLALEALWLSTR